MTIVYCDAADHDERTICAWGCIVIHNCVEHIFSGYSLENDALRCAGLYAIIKSLEAVSQFDANEVTAYTEDADVIYDFNQINLGEDSKFVGTYGRYFERLREFRDKYNLVLREVHPTRNRAHHIANFTLRAEQKRFAYLNLTLKRKSQEHEPKTPQTVIKSCIPQAIKNHKDFNEHIIKILTHCSKQSGFKVLLHSHGVSLVCFYQILKNRFPKKIMYKQNGEKKLHTSFARAILNSEFCVCEMENGLFFIFHRDARPASARIVEC